MPAPRQPRRPGSPPPTARPTFVPRQLRGVTQPQHIRTSSDGSHTLPPVGSGTASSGQLWAIAAVCAVALLAALIVAFTGSSGSGGTSTANANVAANPVQSPSGNGASHSNATTQTPGANTANSGTASASDYAAEIASVQRRLRELIDHYHAFADSSDDAEPAERQREALDACLQARKLSADVRGLIGLGARLDGSVQLDADDIAEAWAGTAVDLHMTALETLADPTIRRESRDEALQTLRETLAGKRPELMPAELLDDDSSAPLRLKHLISRVEREPAQGTPVPAPATEKWWEPGNGSAFRRYQSRRYELTTDLPESYARYILAACEADYPAWQDFLAPAIKVPDDPEHRHVIRIFATLKLYVRYRRDVWKEERPGHNFVYRHYPTTWRGRETLGYFTSHEAVMAGLRHEGFHQVLRAEITYPSNWLNEGIAEFLESSDVKDGRFVPRMHNGWGRQIRQLIGEGRSYRMVPLTELLKMTKAQCQREQGSTYPLSWALVWYLHQVRPGGREVLQQMLAAQDPTADEATNVSRTWQAVFGNDARKLESVVSGYERLMKEISPLPDFNDFQKPYELMQDKKVDEALPLLEKLTRAHPGFEPGLFYYGFALLQKRQPQEALFPFLAAIDRFPQYSSALYEATRTASRLGYHRLAAHLAEETIVHSSTYGPKVMSILERSRGQNDKPGLPALPRMGDWPESLGEVPDSRFALR